MGEQGAEAAQAGEAHLEARFRDVVTPSRQQRLRPHHAQPGEELVRGLSVGLLVDAQEMVRREVRVGGDIRQVDRTPVSVPHEIASFSQNSVRLGVHPDARVRSALPESTTIFARYVRNVLPQSVYHYTWPCSEPEVER